MSSRAVQHPVHSQLRIVAVAGLVAAIAAAGLLLPAEPAHAALVPAYDSTPATQAPSYPSQSFQATSTAEFGDVVTLDASVTERALKEVSVVFVSWACETGIGVSCVTTPGSTFTHPITLNVYDPSDLTTKIASVTQTVTAPYRPTSDPTCQDPSLWRNAATNTCHTGFSFPVDFDFAAVTPEVLLPEDVLVTVEYNTQGHGYTPTGVASGADSLNVAVVASAPTVGSISDADDMYLYSTWAGAYSDGAGDGGPASEFRGSAGWDASLLMEITTDLPTLADPPTTPAAGGPTLAATGTPDYLPWMAALAALVVAAGIVAVVIGARKRRARHVA